MGRRQSRHLMGRCASAVVPYRRLLSACRGSDIRNRPGGLWTCTVRIRGDEPDLALARRVRAGVCGDIARPATGNGGGGCGRVDTQFSRGEHGGVVVERTHGPVCRHRCVARGGCRRARQTDRRWCCHARGHAGERRSGDAAVRSRRMGVGACRAEAVGEGHGPADMGNVGCSRRLLRPASADRCDDADDRARCLSVCAVTGSAHRQCARIPRPCVHVLDDRPRRLSSDRLASPRHHACNQTGARSRRDLVRGYLRADGVRAQPLEPLCAAAVSRASAGDRLRPAAIVGRLSATRASTTERGRCDHSGSPASCVLVPQYALDRDCRALDGDVRRDSARRTRASRGGPAVLS